eukprot:TRINITY_DN5626_c0_g1_i1.p1 TRINITY_DN5626_c0_g1~~TRINITY_DN5626_c0_g1_i1.p1  ORF type:complete len:809 (-),score=236.60 TRINITY_DN5626_c0_g1_i1:58-2484(-)
MAKLLALAPEGRREVGSLFALEYPIYAPVESWQQLKDMIGETIILSSIIQEFKIEFRGQFLLHENGTLMYFVGHLEDFTLLIPTVPNTKPLNPFSHPQLLLMSDFAASDPYKYFFFPPSKELESSSKDDLPHTTITKNKSPFRMFKKFLPKKDQRTPSFKKDSPPIDIKSLDDIPSDSTEATAEMPLSSRNTLTVTPQPHSDTRPPHRLHNHTANLKIPPKEEDSKIKPISTSDGNLDVDIRDSVRASSPTILSVRKRSSTTGTSAKILIRKEDSPSNSPSISKRKDSTLSPKTAKKNDLYRHYSNERKPASQQRTTNPTLARVSTPPKVNSYDTPKSKPLDRRKTNEYKVKKTPKIESRFRFPSSSNLIDIELNHELEPHLAGTNPPAIQTRPRKHQDLTIKSKSMSKIPITRLNFPVGGVSFSTEKLKLDNNSGKEFISKSTEIELKPITKSTEIELKTITKLELDPIKKTEVKQKLRREDPLEKGRRSEVKVFPTRVSHSESSSSSKDDLPHPSDNIVKKGIDHEQDSNSEYSPHTARIVMPGKDHLDITKEKENGLGGLKDVLLKDYVFIVHLLEGNRDIVPTLLDFYSEHCRATEYINFVTSREWLRIPSLLGGKDQLIENLCCLYLEHMNTITPFVSSIIQPLLQDFEELNKNASVSKIGGLFKKILRHCSVALFTLMAENPHSPLLELFSDLFNITQSYAPIFHLIINKIIKPAILQYSKYQKQSKMILSIINTPNPSESHIALSELMEKFAAHSLLLAYEPFTANLEDLNLYIEDNDNKMIIMKPLRDIVKRCAHTPHIT